MYSVTTQHKRTNICSRSTASEKKCFFDASFSNDSLFLNYNIDILIKWKYNVVNSRVNVPFFCSKFFEVELRLPVTRFTKKEQELIIITTGYGNSFPEPWIVISSSGRCPDCLNLYR